MKKGYFFSENVEAFIALFFFRVGRRFNEIVVFFIEDNYSHFILYDVNVTSAKFRG